LTHCKHIWRWLSQKAQSLGSGGSDTHVIDVMSQRTRFVQ